MLILLASDSFKIQNSFIQNSFIENLLTFAKIYRHDNANSYQISKKTLDEEAITRTTPRPVASANDRGKDVALVASGQD